MRHKANTRFYAVFFLILAVIFLAVPSKTVAYEGDLEGLGGDTHHYLAYDVFAVNSLKPYFNELIRYGGSSLYTYSNWASHANWEPARSIPGAISLMWIPWEISTSIKIPPAGTCCGAVPPPMNFPLGHCCTGWRIRPSPANTPGRMGI
jgi:hypothetical protein